MSKHIPVMLHEAINALDIIPDGFYIDCTFGRGGHSKEILKKLNDDGRLLVGFAEDITLDKANRLLIPAELKNYAEIDKNAIFIGQGSHFEIWNCDHYYEHLAQINITEENDFPDELKGFSL